MKKIISVVLSALLMSGLSMPSFADWHPGMEEHWEAGTDWRPDIRERISIIHSRIDQGMHSGSLTRREGRRLHRDLDRVLDDINRMKSDGYLNARERDRIVHELNALADKVWDLKHNGAYR